MDPGGGGNINSYIPTISQSFQPNNNQVSPFQYYDQSNQPNFNQPPNQGVNGGTSTNANNPQIFSPGYAGQGNYLQPSSQPYNANRFPSPQQSMEQQSVANQAIQQNFQLPGQVSYLGVQATHHPQVYRQPTRFLPFQQSNVVSIQPQPQMQQMNSNRGPPPEIDRRKLHSDIDCMITWACMNIFIFGLLFGLAAYIEASECNFWFELDYWNMLHHK